MGYDLVYVIDELIYPVKESRTLPFPFSGPKVKDGYYCRDPSVPVLSGGGDGVGGDGGGGGGGGDGGDGGGGGGGGGGEGGGGGGGGGGGDGSGVGITVNDGG